jgi:hypothetical protein
VPSIFTECSPYIEFNICIIYWQRQERHILVTSGTPSCIQEEEPDS